MITGAHFLLYSRDPEADRRFLRDECGFPWVDAGDGWPIFAMPAAELAVHPATENFVQRHAGHDLLGAVLYLMCDDLDAMVATFGTRGIDCSAVQHAPWGRSTTIPLPGGGRLGLYQPSHPTAIERAR